MKSKDIAIVHDYFFSYGGAEKTVESWLTLYPNAIIYTNFITLENFQGTVFEKLYHKGQIKVTSEQRILGKKMPKLFKLLFWLHPFFARFGIKINKNTDLILLSSIYSSKYSHFPKTSIIHYCHSPTRFLYSGVRTELNHNNFNILTRIILTPIKALLKAWDQDVAKKLINPSVIWLTNSSYNQGIIRDIYHVDSKVIFPPIEVSRFASTSRQPPSSQKGYIVFGRIVPIKKIERAIHACIDLNESLTIVGHGNEEYIQKLRAIALTKPGLIQFVGDISDEEKMQLFSTTKGMIFPALEDFGIAPIEIIASGTPVIALKGAGALEYIQPGVNGLFFDEGKSEKQTIHNLVKTLKAFNPTMFTGTQIRTSVQRFHELHINEMREIIESHF